MLYIVKHRLTDHIEARQPNVNFGGGKQLAYTK